ncbi:hypothetical protein ARMSODRAFT_975890 [Armillaria solidipes]|uniref:Uncharacterized protein n=1 Tax=Armillaria solidipes TaxID=1076256 RepID=A0A2H3BX66_9AGAR|nr:hypothetical protein ARMSODRAFT_975890 [Armillaria solidipes]
MSNARSDLKLRKQQTTEHGPWVVLQEGKENRGELPRFWTVLSVLASNRSFRSQNSTLINLDRFPQAWFHIFVRLPLPFILMTTEFTNRERYLVRDIAIMNSKVVKESLLPRADIESSPDQSQKGMEHIHGLGSVDLVRTMMMGTCLVIPPQNDGGLSKERAGHNVPETTEFGNNSYGVEKIREWVEEKLPRGNDSVGVA